MKNVGTKIATAATAIMLIIRGADQNTSSVVGFGEAVAVFFGVVDGFGVWLPPDDPDGAGVGVGVGLAGLVERTVKEVVPMWPSASTH